MRLRAQTPGGIEALQDGEHGLDLGLRSTELLADLREVAREIAGLVDHVDEILTDHAPCRVGDRQRQLLGQVIGEGGLGGNEGFKVVVAVLATAGSRPGPFGIAWGCLRVRAGRGRIGVSGRHVVETRTFRVAAIVGNWTVRPIRRGGIRGLCGFALHRLRGAAVVSGPLQQRVSLKLSVHVGGEVQI